MGNIDRKDPSQDQPNLKCALEKRQKIGRYSRWIFNNIRPWLGKRVLDIGSGIGDMISFFAEAGCEEIVATDIFADQVEYMGERFRDQGNISVLLFDIASDDEGMLRNYSFDTVTCINVLEHVRDDLPALIKMKSLIRDGGRIILLMPAMTWLFGTMDKASGHYRRYDRARLRHIAEKSGLKIAYHRYMNISGIIPWFIKGRIRKKESTFSDTLNKKSSLLINRATAILEKIENIIPPPAGISHIIVLEK